MLLMEPTELILMVVLSKSSCRTVDRAADAMEVAAEVTASLVAVEEADPTCVMISRVVVATAAARANSRTMARVAAVEEAAIVAVAVIATVAGTAEGIVMAAETEVEIVTLPETAAVIETTDATETLAAILVVVIEEVTEAAIEVVIATRPEMVIDPPVTAPETDIKQHADLLLNNFVVVFRLLAICFVWLI